MVITTSPNVSKFDFDFQLDIASLVPKAVETDISTYIGAGATNIKGIVFKIIDPSNLSLPQTIYPPNVDIYPGLGTSSQNLPYYNGKVKTGTYKISAILYDADGTAYSWVGDDGSTFKSIELCLPNSLQNAINNWGGLNLSVDPNCDLGMLVVQDGGTGFSYNGVSPSETDTALIVTYPIDTTGTTAQQTAPFIPFTFPLTVAGIYSIVGTVTQTYQLTPTTSVKAAYYYQNTFNVQCGYTLCKALCDYERLFSDVQSCSLKNPNEALQQLRTLILVVAYLGKIAWFKNCGKNFGDGLEQLRIIGGFSCNCDCAPQGIAVAPLFMSGGTIVKGNMCGDIDLTLTQFLGNIKLDLSDVSYSVIAQAAQASFITLTPTEGECSKTFTLSINVCAMLGTATIDCLSDVGTLSPPPNNGDVLMWNATAHEWQPHASALPSLTWIPFASTSGNWTIPAGARLEYSKDFLGNVRLRGFITGTGLVKGNFYVLATLPAGYRPSTAAGEVYIEPATTGSLIVAPSPAMITILNTGQILLTLNLDGTWNMPVNCEFNVN